MTLDIAKEHLEKTGLEDRVYTFEISSATVELAASTMRCEPARMAKALSFVVKDGPVLTATAGDAKVNSHKYKEQFKTKTRMLSPGEMMDLVGHSVSGAYSFGVKEEMRVYLNESLKRLDVVCPVCGNASNVVRPSIPELERASGYLGWIDVCKV